MSEPDIEEVGPADHLVVETPPSSVLNLGDRWLVQVVGGAPAGGWSSRGFGARTGPLGPSGSP
jgi:hypothetical protein